MFVDNRYYGHAATLARAAGVPAGWPILGRLQHGWTPLSSVAPMFRRRRERKLLWAWHNLRGALEEGRRNLDIIGAPYLYLPPVTCAEPGSGLLAFPFHGWESERVAGDFAQYADALEQLGRDGFSPITVCLYWLEYEDPKLRAVFERRGMRVVTNGRRDGNPEFLSNLRSLIHQHRYVTSNRVATASFYALASDRPFFFYGPPVGLSASRDPTGEQYDAYQRQAFPELAYAGFRDRVERSTAERELGAEFVRTPDQLRQALGWRVSSLPELLAATPVSWADWLAERAQVRLRIPLGM